MAASTWDGVASEPNVITEGGLDPAKYFHAVTFKPPSGQKRGPAFPSAAKFIWSSHSDTPLAGPTLAGANCPKVVVEVVIGMVEVGEMVLDVVELDLVVPATVVRVDEVAG